MGNEFRQVSADRYEHVLVRDPKLDLYQGIFITFPELNEYFTKDLWSKHPTKPNHWLYEGRQDDIIVFSNGEKLNPLTLEQQITCHPEVRGAVVAGSNRFQPCLIVEPEKDITSTSEEEAFIERVWPTVNKANEETVAHGRIDRNLILVTHPNRHLSRASKGSVQRKQSIQLYEAEIDRLYATLSDAQSPQDKLDLSNDQAILESLRSAVSEMIGVDAPADDVDLFSQGFDSVSVISLSRQINSSLGSNVVSSRAIYSNGTIQKLAGLISRGEEYTSVDKNGNREEHMEAIYHDYATRLLSRYFHPLPADTFNIILTGSTGSIGSYILDLLLKNKEVNHIYCLNRSQDAHERQEKSTPLSTLSPTKPLLTSNL